MGGRVVDGDDLGRTHLDDHDVDGPHLDGADLDGADLDSDRLGWRGLVGENVDWPHLDRYHLVDGLVVMRIVALAARLRQRGAHSQYARSLHRPATGACSGAEAGRRHVVDIARRFRVTVVVASAACLLGGIVGVGAPVAVTAVGPHTGSYIVQAAAGEMGVVTREIRAKGGGIHRSLGSVDMAVASLSPAGAAELARMPSVVAVTPDSRLTLASTTYDGKEDASSMYSLSTVIGARDTWGRYTGRGVDVALIDSGVSRVPGLKTPGKVLSGPDLSLESQNPSLLHRDSFGHGTHMAGIIAGRDEGTDLTRVLAGDSTAFLGVAPDARIISLKVADAFGVTDVSQVIAAIDWVVTHRRDPGINIRVLNLSFGTRALNSYQVDPLAHAAEVAWRSGILVVASAGNDGSGTGRLSNPSYDPRLLAVGAVDPNGTRDTADDTVPAYSSRGDGVRDPDIVAPGAHVQGLRVPGSHIDDQYGDGPGSINERFLRGSGTSQAAAVVSGAAALLFEQRPGLTPDQAKALLTSSARQLPAADPQASGHGLVNIKKAIQTATPSSGQPWAPATGTGTLQGARGGTALVQDGVALQGEQDIFGSPYDSAGHAIAEAGGTAWDGGSWNGNVWTGVTWAGVTWAGVTWAGVTWAGVTWAASSWNNGTWTGTTWAGTTWAGVTWATGPWGDSTWSASVWSIGEWR